MESTQQEPTEQPEKNVSEKQAKRGIISIIIISVIFLILLGMSGFLGYLYIQNAAEIKEKKEALVALEINYKAAQDSLTQIRHQINELYADQLISDSLMQAQIGEIDQLKTDLEVSRKQGKPYTGSGVSSKLTALRIEMDAKYALLKGERDRLQLKSDSLQQLYVGAREKHSQLQQENNQIKATLDVAKEIKIFETVLIGFRMKRNGTRLLDDRVRKLTHLDAHFSIMENPIAEQKEYTAYIVIIGPGKEVIHTDFIQTFEYMGVEKNYSAKKQINYVGKKMDIYVSIEVGAKTLEPGKYTIEVYLDDVLSGKKKVEFF